ncbi:tyrosine-protein phosphatase 10D isoform X2 [Lingula anatina]|uniref:protein-tyrosine-phosphatase n=1 Tax=Lingula anatina TaxID=7574 RepID=A0A1S3HGB4_LINAN|nr:tyrosine-protein phosphatase 10D isoform X2 [Lingula anatina]|eukprot:XP_013385097.1 tyrosine-protein phosphatase 10D isoform X2 [Lingula anatina]
MGNKGGMLRFTLLVILTASSYAAITITRRQTESLNISIDIQRNTTASNYSYIIKYGENPSTDKNITKSPQDVSLKKLEVILQNLRSGTEYKIEVFEVSNANMTLLANTTAYTAPLSPVIGSSKALGTHRLQVVIGYQPDTTQTQYVIKWQFNSSSNEITAVCDPGAAIAETCNFNVTASNPAGHLYTINAYTYVGNASYILSEPAMVNQTTEPGPPRNLSFSNVGTKQLDVTWDAPADAPATGHFTRYNIQLESLNSSYNFSQNKNVSTRDASFTELTPGVQYRATVAAQLETLQSDPVTAVDNTRPDTPTNPSFNSTESSITVSWGKGDGISDGYIIRINSSSLDINVSSTSKEFTGLNVGTSYVITLKAYSGNRFSDEVTLNAWTKPGAPEGLELSPNTRTNVSGTFTWRAPSSGEVDAYRIRLLHKSNGIEIESQNITDLTSLSNSFDGLYPGRSYTVEVRSAYKGALSTSSSVNFTTKPNRPSYLRVTAKTTSTITVEWSRGSGTESDREVLSLSKDGQTLASENVSNGTTLKKFTNLISGETYNISVTTQSNGVQSDPVTITETTPPLAPEFFSTTPNGIGTTFVEVTWEYPENVTKDFLSLTISGSSLTRIVNITSNQSAFTERKYKFENLSTGQQYVVTLRFASDGVFGDNKTITVTTFPSSLAALDVKNTTTTSITVGWNEVSNTTFDRYQLHILPNDGNADLPINVSRNSSELQHTFTGLYPGRMYNISIWTASGSSASEARYREYTTNPLAVSSLMAKAIDTSNIQLNWTVSLNSTQDHFLIQYNDKQKKYNESTASGPKAYVLRNLKPGFAYNITVQAVSSLSYSEDVTIGESTYPVPVSNLVAETAGYTNISITWKIGIVNTLPSHQSQFRIRYRPVLRDINATPEERNVTVNSAVIDELYPGEKYDIQVIAVGKYRSESKNTTAYTYPKPPKNFKEIENSENSLTLGWVKAETYLTQYKIEYRALPPALNRTLQTKFTNGSEYVFTGLESGVTYTVSIFAVTDDVESPDSTTGNFTTKPIADFSLSENAATSSSVVALSYTENSGIFDYFLFCLDGPTCNITQRKSKTDAQRVVQFNGSGVVAGDLYTIQAQTVSADQHSESKQIKIRTNPNGVEQLHSIPGANMVEISWQKPEGTVSGYRVLLFLDSTLVENATLPSDTNTVVVNNLTSYKQYIYRVYTVSGIEKEKESNPVVGTFNTSVSVPSAVLNFEVVPGSLKPYEVALRWDMPTNPNGILQEYLISYVGVKNTVMTVMQNVSITNTSVRTTTISQLQAGYTYTFKIRAKTSEGYGPEVNIHLLMPVLAPAFDETVPEIQRTPRKPDQEEPQTTSLVVEFSNVFTERNGEIIGYTVIVVETSPNNDSVIVVGADLPTWKEAQYTTDDKWLPYEAFGPCELFDATSNNLCSNIKRTIVKRATTSESRVVQVKIGTDNCNSLPANTYCNGPLKPNTHYRFSLRAKTENGLYADTPFSKVIATNKKPDSPSDVVAVVVSILVVILLVGVLIGVLIYLRRRGIICKEKDEDEMTGSSKLSMSSLRHSLRRLSHRGKRSADKASHLVRLEEFPDFVKMMSKDSDFGYSEEYEDLKEVGRNQPWDEAEIPHNRGKNRFTNILPYDHSRVKLLPTDDEDGSDYINANYMPGFSSMREYIVTQGPLPSTVDDFWRMVWEQNCRAIVMLTKCVEKGREKCHQYWPSDSEPAMYGDLQVTILNETRTPEWNISEFKIAKGEQARNIRHFHYTAWPDFGVPTRPQSLIKFVRTVREKLPKEGGPIVVHCSAGVGRSGTFIVLDRLMQHIKDHDSVDIYGVVHQMRGFRVYMVQTEAQYICIHQCLLCVLEGREDEDMNYSEGMSNMGFEGTKLIPPTSPIESAPLIPEKGQDDEGITVEVT